jgi:stage V sporulation protein R
VRAEAYYFQPQRMTRIMNEGWASFWHSRILTGGVLDASEIVDFADCHSGATRRRRPRQSVQARHRALALRRGTRRGPLQAAPRHNDASFVDLLLDDEFVARHALFVHQKNTRTGKQEIADRSAAKVRERLLTQLAWGGLPRIELSGVGEGRALELVHRHDGRDLDLQKASDTLQRVATLWKGPVRLGTRLEGVAKRLSWADGAFESVDLSEPVPDPA